ncbi:regulatory protein RecX [Lachnospiraceae bacterium]|nr:regulatory protein RecX [Lachnospiraceae bacterium]GFI69445.1 regulatory protein RecX [Lachnospiraceae bacterium]
MRTGHPFCIHNLNYRRLHTLPFRLADVNLSGGGGLLERLRHMTVTEIKEITKSRVKVAIDGEPAFVLYKGELRAYGIKEGQEIREEDYQTILTQILPKRAKMRALNLLKSRAYTSFQLEEKLTMGGYPREIILEALSYVESFGYINDSQYAADFIEYNKEKKSRNRMAMDLRKKGIPDVIIREAMENAEGADSEELEKTQIVRWMEKKRFTPHTATLQEKNKMTAFLFRKGFSIDTIRNVLSLDITSI